MTVVFVPGQYLIFISSHFLAVPIHCFVLVFLMMIFFSLRMRWKSLIFGSDIILWKSSFAFSDKCDDDTYALTCFANMTCQNLHSHHEAQICLRHATLNKHKKFDSPQLFAFVLVSFTVQMDPFTALATPSTVRARTFLTIVHITYLIHGMGHWLLCTLMRDAALLGHSLLWGHQ